MLVIIGPSASGKTQLVQELVNDYGMEKLVTYTTRAMRPNEVNGRDYNFISKEEFNDKIAQNFFLEYTEYHGNYYGTSRSDLAPRKVVILESSGLRNYIKEARDQIKIVFLRCSSNILRLRMLKRGDSIESVNKRLSSDKSVFSNEIAMLADWIVDSSASNIYEDAKIIYNLYKPYLEEQI